MTENTLTIDATNKTVVAVVNQIKSDMRGGSKYGAYVTEFGVTHETVKDHAAALAGLVTPVGPQKKDGQRTRYGNAVQAAGNGLRSALGKKDGATETDWIRLVRQAAENANVKGEFHAEVIIAAVAEALNMELDGSDTAGGLHLAPVA